MATSANSEKDFGLSFRAVRKAKLRASRNPSVSEVVTKSSTRRRNLANETFAPDELTRLELVQSSRERRDVSATYVLHGLAYANEFNALELYLSLFELFLPGSFTSDESVLELKKIGYDVQVIQLSDEVAFAQYLHNTGWTKQRLLAWTNGQWPLEDQLLWTGFCLYSLLVGKELNNYNFKPWVSKKARSLYAVSSSTAQPFWCVEKFTAQIISRQIYQQLRQQPLRRKVVQSLLQLRESTESCGVPENKIVRLALHYLSSANMSHIGAIFDHLIHGSYIHGPYKGILFQTPLCNHLPDLGGALEFLNTMPGKEYFYTCLLRDESECLALRSKTLLPFTHAAHLAMGGKGNKLKHYRGADIPPELNGLASDIRDCVEEEKERQLRLFAEDVKILFQRLSQCR